MENSLSNYELPSGQKLFEAELSDNGFTDLSGNIRQEAFDWQQHSKCAKFARFEIKGRGYYIKKFENRNCIEWFKNLHKGSRAVREFRGNMLLSENGINTPQTMAIIDNQSGNYIITREIKSQGTLNDYMLSPANSVQDKRAAAKEMARILAHLHNNKIILGDINMNNALVGSNGRDIYLLDNERSYKRTFIDKGVMKNLVHLNKNPLPGIAASERLRFFKTYAAQRQIDFKNKYLLRSIIHRTIKRRAKSSKR